MPDGSMERRFPRYLIQLPLLHKNGTHPSHPIGMAWTRTLSDGGACVEFATSLQPEVPLVLRFRTDRGAIAAGANVVWVGDPGQPGKPVPHGLTFTPFASDQHRTLQKLITWGREQGRADIRLSFEVSATCQCAGARRRPPVQGLTGDIGRGGHLLLLPRVLPSRTHLKLTLQTVRRPLPAQT